MRALKLCRLVFLLALPSGVGFEGVAQTLSDPSAFASIQDRAVRSRAILGEMARVITSPRCMNCHPAADWPSQGDDMHPHVPFAGRGEGGVGVDGDSNFTLQEGASYQSIPGHPRWGLAPT